MECWALGCTADRGAGAAGIVALNNIGNLGCVFIEVQLGSAAWLRLPRVRRRLEVLSSRL